MPTSLTPAAPVENAPRTSAFRRLVARTDRRVLRSLLYLPAMTAVFLLFRVTEWFVEHYFSVGTRQSMAVALATAIGLAIVFQMFHHRVESAVERWLNRHSHARLHELGALAKEITLIGSAAVLQQRVLDRIEEVMTTTGAAIYLGQADDNFTVVRANGDYAPREIHGDDPVVIQLRLHHRGAAPKASGSRVAVAMLWPMLVRGRVIGLLCIGERRHTESLDEREIHAVGEIASAVGMALAMLGPSLAEQDRGRQVSLPKMFSPGADTAQQGKSRHSSYPELAPIDDSIPSIAVLAFVNIGRDPDNEYFADGLSEELLNVLAKIPGLRVASRTSAFSFKGLTVDIPTIALKLNVATVLEGSVRKSGTRVRVTAQLVHVATDSRLWSDTYERELKDIFAVQDDIAKSVVEELRTTLLGATATASTLARAEADVETAALGRSDNAEAYRMYLQGQFFRDHLAKESTAHAIECYEAALKVDPNYALAWAGVSRAYSDAAGQNWIPHEEGYAKARDAAQRAIKLHPDLAEAHSAIGWVLKSSEWDWKGADAAFRRALELAPGSTLAMNGAATLAGNLGRFGEAIALLRRASVLDPLNVALHRNLGLYCVAAGELVQAEAALKETLRLSPQGGLTYCWLSLVYLAQGRIEEALATVQREVSEIFHLLGLSVVQHALGNPSESSLALEQLIDQHGRDAAYQVAGVYAYRGDPDRAFEWLEKSYAERDPGLIYMKVDPLLQSLHGDPRWLPFLTKMQLAD